MHLPAATAAAPPPTLLYDAVLRPHRSLGRAGFAILMACVGAVTLTSAVAFVMAGAWPVSGFFGLDVLLLYLAFRASYRSGEVSERLQLSDDALTVRRLRPDGRESVWRFQPYWLKVRMEGPPGTSTPLTLESHGRRLEVGAFLPLSQRLVVANDLRAALSRLGNPYAV